METGTTPKRMGGMVGQEMEITPKATSILPKVPQNFEWDDTSSYADDDVASQISEAVSNEPSLPDSVSESMLTMSQPVQVDDGQLQQRRLEQRQKQIDLGKNTIGYLRYTQQVPRNERKKNDPKTPDKYAAYSKRGWDGTMKVWRRKLHAWDPPELQVQYQDKVKNQPNVEDPLASLPMDQQLTMEQVEQHLKGLRKDSVSSISSTSSIFNPEAPEFTPSSWKEGGMMVQL